MEFEMHVTKGKLISEKWNFFPSFWVERDGVAWSRRKIKNSFLENKKKKIWEILQEIYLLFLVRFLDF